MNGRDIATFDDVHLTQYRRHEVGFVFQFFNLIPTLTSLENVEFAAELVNSPREPMEVLAEVPSIRFVRRLDLPAVVRKMSA